MAETEETSHITSVRTQWRLRQQAARKPHFKIVDGEIVRYAVSAPADDLATTVAHAQEEEISAALIGNADPSAAVGQMIAGKGIFVRIWEPKDREGNSLGKIFNMYAAPQDLTDNAGNAVLLDFNDAAVRVAKLKGWNGHDGGDFKNDTELFAALKSGRYNGEWFIPTYDLIFGNEVAEGEAQLESLLRGNLKGIFTIVSSFTKAHSHYWSCTEFARQTYMVATDLTDEYFHWYAKDAAQFPTRPVRVELRP